MMIGYAGSPSYAPSVTEAIGLVCGAAIRIVTVTDLHAERILRRAGWPLARIGEPHTIGTTRPVAGYLDVSKIGSMRPSRRVQVHG